MKRSILLLGVALSGATGWSQSGGYQAVPFEQIAGPNRSIHDPQTHVSATVPLGWNLRRAQRNDKGETSIAFVVAKTPAAAPSLYYQFSDTARAAAGDIQATLRDGAAKKAQQRAATDGFAGYANRADSFVARQIGGLPALSWAADYTRQDRAWSEYLTRVASDRGTILFFLNAPADEMAAVRPAFERMIETVRIGGPVMAQIGEMSTVQLVDVARVAPGGSAGAPDGLSFRFLVARNSGVEGKPTIKETKDMGIAGQSYQRGNQQKLGKAIEPTTVIAGVEKFVADYPNAAGLIASDPASTYLLTITLPGAALEAGADAAIILNVGFNQAVEKLTFHTKVPDRPATGD
jgi:hypothetical protein